jgi:hypothetical protein
MYFRPDRDSSRLVIAQFCAKLLANPTWRESRASNEEARILSRAHSPLFTNDRNYGFRLTYTSTYLPHLPRYERISSAMSVADTRSNNLMISLDYN